MGKGRGGGVEGQTSTFLAHLWLLVMVVPSSGTLKSTLQYYCYINMHAYVHQHIQYVYQVSYTSCRGCLHSCISMSIYASIFLPHEDTLVLHVHRIHAQLVKRHPRRRFEFRGYRSKRSDRGQNARIAQSSAIRIRSCARARNRPATVNMYC